MKNFLMKSAPEPDPLYAQIQLATMGMVVPVRQEECPGQWRPFRQRTQKRRKRRNKANGGAP